MTPAQILSRVKAWRVIHEDAFKSHGCADDQLDAEICAAIEKMLAGEKCYICSGVGIVTTWRDGGTAGQIKDTLICGNCGGTGKESSHD